MSRNDQGFTLVELIIGMAIFVLIMSGTFGILASSVKSYQYNFEQAQNIQDSRQLFNEITKGIKNATTITIPNSSTLNYSITTNTVTDHYVISLNSITSAVEFKKNTDTTRNFGAGRVSNILFLSSNSGSKKEIAIELYFKSNVAQPIKTAVTTLNNVP